MWNNFKNMLYSRRALTGYLLGAGLIGLTATRSWFDLVINGAVFIFGLWSLKMTDFSQTENYNGSFNSTSETHNQNYKSL